LQEIIASNTIKIDFMGSDQYSKNFDAAAKYYDEEIGYGIFFNSRKIGPFDYSPNRRCNFTLAHELGHIFLEHLFIPYELKSEEQRLYEDWEADEFASRLLMPENLVLQCNFITGLTGQFLVTSYDLFKRVNNLKRLDLYKTKPLPTCKICGNTHFSPAARYCKICGTEVTHFTTRGILRIVYSKLADGMNKCQDGHDNDRNARYCEFCGKPTLGTEVLPAWQVEREKYIKSLVHMDFRKKIDNNFIL
jgi:hypothetical protein